MRELIIVQTFDEDGFLTGYEVKGEIVRCKDCEHWEYDVIFQDGWCRVRRQGNPEWFCADGERRSK